MHDEPDEDGVVQVPHPRKPVGDDIKREGEVNAGPDRQQLDAERDPSISRQAPEKLGQIRQHENEIACAEAALAVVCRLVARRIVVRHLPNR